MRGLSLLLCLALSCFLASSQVAEEVCPLEFTSRQTVDEIIKNPPNKWNIACFTDELVDEFLKSRSRIENVVECLETVQLCKSHGYEVITDEIINRIGSGGNCFNCNSRRLLELVSSTTRKLQKQYPKLLRRGLAVLA